MLNTIQLRHQMHAHPELSGQEAWTSAFVVEQLQKIGVSKIHTGFSQHSILAEIDGQNAGKTLLFRCELDALPIQEANNFAHRSTQNGISHKCGHDGHSATMLAFAQKLFEKPLKNGKILLFFQSAEETGAGAAAAMASGIFNQFNIDYAFAYHNLPSFPLGSVLCKEGIFTPSVESFNLTLIGKDCHASQPANGINPANAVATIITFMNTLHQPDKSKTDYFVVTPIHIKSAANKNDLKFIDMTQPFDFGEDFGLFTDAYKGAMFGIGSGENCPALHTIDYDFPDELIEIGSDMFLGIAQNMCF